MIEEAKNPPQNTSIDYSVYTDNISLAEFAKIYHEADVDSDGNLLTTYNPKSKWDWYKIGGVYVLPLKTGKGCNRARLSLLNLSKKKFFTHAVITEDGIWHEVGQMGWWGNSSETEEERKAWVKTYWDRFIKELPGNTPLAIIDCHI